MAEWTGQKTLEDVLDAARQWKDRCLLRDGSIFGSGQLWTRENFARLKEAFVDNPIEGDESFADKLRTQLKDASPHVSQLAAEAFWLLNLFVGSGNMRPETKRDRIAKIWELSGAELPNVPTLSNEALIGVANSGAAFITLVWKEFRYLVLLMLAWKSLDAERQHQLLNADDPWGFCKWATSFEDGDARAFRHMILFLCYPVFFERICSQGHKKRIYVTFRSKLSDQTDPFENDQSPCGLDKAIYAIRQKLEGEYGTMEIDFYKDPLREQWQPEGTNDSAPIDPSPVAAGHVWIEKTIVKGRTDRTEGTYALGHALWSPQKAKGGQDIYRFMREVMPGDAILHLTDNEGFSGISVAAEAMHEFEGVAGTEWGIGPSYLIPLRDFVALDPPLSREMFFKPPFRNRLVGLIDAGAKNLFYNREPSLNQGAYLTTAPQKLLEILDDAYVQATGKHLPIASGTLPPTADGSVLNRSSSDEMQRILDRLQSRDLHFSPEIVSNYLLALRTKRFVILAGLSGTGKTQLAMAVAESIAPKVRTEIVSEAQVPVIEQRSTQLENYRIVAVRPDWTDSRGLLGYYNPLSKQYVAGSGLELLLLARDEVLRANQENRRPYPFFLILDEMNLAHVEQYFAEFLSCTESNQPLDLHQDADLESGAGQNERAIPRRLPIPRNVYFTGTVNVDETTYMFSPKVLDRAFTIELQDVDLRGFGKPIEKSSKKGEFVLVNLPTLGNYQKPRLNDWKSFEQLESGAVHTILLDLNDILTPYTRHFGYRVANEIAAFVCLAAQHTDGTTDSIWAALDIAILEKVLPKFHGTQEELDESLLAFFSFVVTADRNASVLNWADLKDRWEVTDGRLVPKLESLAPRLPRTAAKIWLMLLRLHRQGFTSFIS